VRQRLTILIGCLAFAALLAQTVPAPADEWGSHYYRHYRHHYAHYVRTAYVEPEPYYPACRVGWWQSLRYGRVHPYWAAFCR
jgi:hypothetical protein